MISTRSFSSTYIDTLASGRERRQSKRWRTLLPGQVELADLNVRLGCRVLDMSARGARIELDQLCAKVRSAADLPASIVLALPVDRVDVVAHVRWRRGDALGVEFSSAFRPRATAHPA